VDTKLLFLCNSRMVRVKTVQMFLFIVRKRYQQSCSLLISHRNDLWHVSEYFVPNNPSSTKASPELCILKIEWNGVSIAGVDILQKDYKTGQQTWWEQKHNEKEWVVQESPVSQKYSNRWNLGRDGVQKVHSAIQVMKNVCLQGTHGGYDE
jgi:hypothetical protein